MRAEQRGRRKVVKKTDFFILVSRVEQFSLD